MNSRDEILLKIKELKLEASRLPSIPDFSSEIDMTDQFVKVATENHSHVIHCFDTSALQAQLTKLATRNFISDIDQLPNPTIVPTPDSVETYFVHGQFGVAENAAIWMSDDDFSERILPFITLHLVVVISRKNLVTNMHDAYNRIQQIPGFGVFVAGPSKTADIEQSLVIGAHGPKQMTILLT